jgi:hypothetical protein
MVEMHLEAVEVSDIPAASPGRQGNGGAYQGILSNFVNSNEQAARIEAPEGTSFRTIYQGLRHAWKRGGFEGTVTIVSRKGQVFLVRN